jgi:hypothetical protein
MDKVKVTWELAFGKESVPRESIVSVDMNVPGFILAEVVSNSYFGVPNHSHNIRILSRESVD